MANTFPADYNGRIDELVSRLSEVGCSTDSCQLKNLILLTGITVTTLLNSGDNVSEWFESVMAQLTLLVLALKPRGLIVSPDQLVEYALRDGKKMSELRELTPEGLAGLVSKQIERINRSDKDRSPRFLRSTA
ncbi:MAG: hypothetical protein WAP74_02220 [Patescibacteria group bacterium]